MRKTISRFILLMLALSLTVSVLGGCSKTGNEAEGTTGAETTAGAADLGGYEFVLAGADLLDPEGETYRNTSLGDELSALYGQIEDTYNCKISFALLQGGSADFIAAVVSGVKLCDFAYLSQSCWLPALAQNALTALDTDEMRAAGLDVNDEGSFYQPYTHLSDLTSGGETHTWGVDLSGRFIKSGVGGMFVFNKGLLQNAGYSSEEVFRLVREREWTYEKMLLIADGFETIIGDDGKISMIGVAHGCDGREAWSNGASLFEFDGGSGERLTNLTDERFLPAFTFMRLLEAGNGVDRYNGSETLQELESAYLDGKAAFMGYDGSRLIDTSMLSVADPYGFVPVPLGPDAQEYKMVMRDVKLFCMPASCGEWEKAAFIMGKIAPGVQSGEEYLQYIRMSVLTGCDESYGIFTELLMQNLVLDIAASSDGLRAITDEFFTSILSGEKTPAQAISQYNALIQAELDAVYNPPGN